MINPNTHSEQITSEKSGFHSHLMQFSKSFIKKQLI